MQMFFMVLHEFSMNSAWIQHHSDLNYCRKLFKIQGENEISMKSAWIQHEFNTILISSTVQSFVEFKAKMKSAWNQHEISMNSTPLWFQLQYQSMVKPKMNLQSASIQHQSDTKYSNTTFQVIVALIQHQARKHGNQVIRNSKKLNRVFWRCSINSWMVAERECREIKFLCTHVWRPVCWSEPQLVWDCGDKNDYELQIL